MGNTATAQKEKTVEDLIYEARQKGHNVLMPSTNIGELSEFHKAVIDEVQLSEKPENGDCYAMFGKENSFALTKQALTKLSVAAGVIWNPAETRRTDNRADRNYVSFQAVGGLRKVDGSPVFFKAEYDMDFEVIEEELRIMYRNKCAKWNKEEKERLDYIESCVRRDLLQKRKHKIKLCESGAMNRVIRWLLGVKSFYTQAELKKPFVVVRVIIRPDFSSKEVRQKMIQAAVNSIANIYGGTPQAQITYDSRDVIDLPHDTCDDDSRTEEQDSRTSDAQPASETERDFIFSMQEQDQVVELENMAYRKGYDLKSLQCPVSEMSLRNRQRFFDHLATLSNIEHGSDEDDIPF